MIQMKHSSFKRLATALCGFLLCMPMLFAQNTITVRGKVLDQDKQPVIGAAVLQVGTTNGAATDIDGNFTLTCPAGADLEVSSIGYTTVTVKAAANLSITLEEENTTLDETVVVGYDTQKKASLTSAIANIREEELMATKSVDVTSSLQGKVPGLLIHQVSGGAGDFDTDLNIRGFAGEPIVVVDGVVRTTQRRGRGFGYGSYSNSSSAVLSQLNPEDIESISVLKDASASIYGMGAGNGVILVTTKKGAVTKPSVRYSNTFSFGVPTALPEEVDLATFMIYRNQMLDNTHSADDRFSAEDIAHARAGDRGYEGVNWHEVVMKKFSFQQNHTLSVSGGNNQTQYYLSARFNQDKGILNGKGLGYNAGNFQGNITTKITDNLTATYQSSFDLNQRMGISTSNSEMNFYYYVGLSRPDTGPTVLDNPSHYSTANYEHWNPAAILDTDTMGYSKTKMNSYNNSLDLKYEAPFLKGLTIDAFASYNVSQRQTNLLDKTVQIYEYLTDSFVENKGTTQYSESWNKSQQLYGKIQANYNKRFGNHSVTGMLAAETRINWTSSIGAGRQYGGAATFFTHDTISQGVDDDRKSNNGTRSSSASAGYIARATYDYKGKYMAEVSGRLDGSYLYAPGYRWGFFPAYSLGWRASEEPFFKNLFPWMNNFKLRFSDGQTSISQGSAYAWQLGYSSSGSYYAFDAGVPLIGYANNAAAETIVSWQHVRMTDVGFDFEVKNGLIGGSVDWFWRNISGIAANSIYANAVPDFYGISLPQYNLNKNQNVGIDLQLSHRHHIGKLNYRITATATFTRNRQTHIASAETATYGSHQAYYNSFSEGRWSNARSGSNYHWVNGGEQFTSWADINDYNIYTGTNPSNMIPGMYKLEDRDGNGVINGQDRYYSWGSEASGLMGGGNNPPLQFGLMIFLNWKDFDMSATFSGATMDNKYISLSGPYGYGYFWKFYKTYDSHYQLAEGYTDPFDPQSKWVAGYWPAFTTASWGGDTGSNGTYRYNQPYDWINATYLRLKSLEIGYTLPRNLTGKIGLKSARIYLSGTNLLTFCDKLIKPYDPERNFGWIGGGGGAPILKTFSFGMNINF
ncbi:MAG: SusC/RagA family TonB-linked outer membrane protein [Bacteroidales bacterium]|nr:SusC/RagA family TonB-linked outer membrane protein [Bacteroidales bacterium]